MAETKSEAQWRQFRVLVVDDDPDMRMLIEAVIAGVWPHAEIAVFDPLDENATHIYDWSRYDLMILDYQLGSQSGLDWLRQYRSVPDFPLTIFITGAGNEDVAVKALKLGAVDYVRKGEGFQGRLISAINEALTELHERVSEQSDWARFLDHVEKTIGDRQVGGAMFYVTLDQFTSVKATKGVHIAQHILNALAGLVREELGDSGAQIRTEVHGENAIVALGSGLQQVEEIELLAGRILDKVRKVRFRIGDGELVGTASVGVCVAEAGNREAARLVARAEAACHTAMLRGGNQSYLGMLQGEIGEAVSSDQGIGKVWRDDGEINELLKSRRLRTLFLSVRPLTAFESATYLRAAPTVARPDGTGMDAAEMRNFQAVPGRRTFLDRVTISQTLRKLQAEARRSVGDTNIVVFLRLSGESVGMPRFWTWLAGRVSELPEGASLVFELAVQDRHARNLPIERLNELAAVPGCTFALHGMLPDLNLAAWVDGLPVRYHVLDLTPKLATQHCDQIVQLVKEAARQGVDVLLTGIDDNVRFSCAFRAGAALLEGPMANEWEEMELSDGPEGGAHWMPNKPQ